jgi:acyl carrier protein
MSPSQWLAQWFAERAPGVALAPEQNFFDQQAIDSFGIIELIEEVETQFGIRFADRDFQDRRFPTVAGLAQLIEERLTGAVS